MSKYVKISEAAGTEAYAMRAPRYDDSAAPVRFISHETYALSARARFAMECIIRWGMFAGVPDGEDHAGRAKGRNATPDEIAHRACETAQTAFEEFERRGWLLDMPGFDRAEAMLRDAEDSN
jgi:hypothetical protein